MARETKQKKETKMKMKAKWNMTVSGACKTFKGFELIEVFEGTIFEAQNRRAKLEKETGRIIYLAAAKN